MTSWGPPESFSTRASCKRQRLLPIPASQRPVLIHPRPSLIFHPVLSSARQKGMLRNSNGWDGVRIGWILSTLVVQPYPTPDGGGESLTAVKITRGKT